MSEGTIGLIVFAVLALICPLIAHFVVREARLAHVIAVVATVSLFQIGAYWHLGHLDPFWLVAVITTGAMAFAASVAVRHFVRKVTTHIWPS